MNRIQAERRWWPRLKVNWRMMLFRADGATPIPAMLENISGGGMLFTSSAPVLAGERLTCQIVLPLKTGPYGDSAVLECELAVIRNHPGDSDHRIGCEFRSYRVCLRPEGALYPRTPSTALSRSAQTL